ncbi:MAG TPA: class II aldolase/adducin family protein [Pseudonocardia sp.]|uniref:class II aldolase/adducin family protein n=1 Tax=Pseudonocardia sp. TaxID=60912 RepID=UPI002B4B4562|nr:class II aldolase/adducin family protein [Pseudonocardia sp.]HLU54887.1 class II aldolase/adducin family protein [Pseudonocardia sp.]
MSSEQDPFESARTELVLANHILARHGVVDGWGHVSVRKPGAPDRFILARSLAPALVTEDDLLELDVATGETVDGGRSYLERHIHSGIYRARPDVTAVVHSHAPDLIPFGVTDTELLPLLHVSAFLGQGAPRFEIRDAAGPATGMLVDTPALGDALGAALGDAPIVLMRGHGVSVVGSSVREAVYRAVYARQNARAQLQTLALGGTPVYLNRDEARLASANVDRSVDRVWDLWVRETAG